MVVGTTISGVDILAPGLQSKLLQQVTEFAAIAGEAAALADETGHIEQRVWSSLHDSGLLLAPFAPALGGAGLGLRGQEATLCTILRLLGGADLSLARLFEGHVNAVMIVSRYGTPDQVEALAGSVRIGGMSGVWGAEDAIGLQRTPSGDAWVLQGRKILASGAGAIAHPLITLSTSDGQILYLLDLGKDQQAEPDSWSPLGMRASASGTIDLSGIVVGIREQIGAAGDYMRQPFFSAGAWRYCAAQLGAMERLLTLYCDHLRTRGRDGDPYQLERVARCTAACATTLYWVEEASRRFADESLEPAGVVAYVNLTRMVTEQAALEVLACVQRGVGLAGFLRPSPIERISRDLSTYLRQPVPDLAMSDAARAVLAGTLLIGATS
jgi:alkylation response protein AidB-like acyl-CoA dehydrogenase